MSAPDQFAPLRLLTPARVRLDPATRPTPLSALLAFQEDHAAARDAIHAALDMAALAQGLAPRPCLQVESRAVDRATYLRRPDLGRQLAEDTELPRLDCDLALVVCDGLSAPAAMAQAPGVVAALSQHLPELATQPVVLVRGGRVAIGDPIGAALGAAMVLVLIGERPGLSVADSLGAYLTLNPRPGLRDSARNCVSNIHPRGGLSHKAAADRLAWLVAEARRIGATGVALKDESGQAAIAP
ncbi:ethanolamine ammonia-lyase subunit EutC [Paracoccus shanxieyensis]|uniref:Ethanolamine ammonia-lyase small subunit n=1 Tax=Paracoccus shanxieyensis TaxID=2675752 RepID=A0A6L6J4L6_9RHOB|nr:ethanolamine ammonia-lyase subunit EutC [Paracoccus shanxieyensis]MTH65664.1 ethanolamine ammonia-lyase subunit EutC [Paracoccus shanxieyensis]MTH88761.1 ethanolamine ammonia-lyase subunit EutC [Paracoccus shanxieyensis]